MMETTLFIVCGSNISDGRWTQYIICRSPGEAINIAIGRKPWTIGDPLTVDMPLDFVDSREPLSEGPKE